MISCLLNYIGIRSCPDESETPVGGWINSLPGISLESVDKIADSEQITYKGVWADVQVEASDRFYVDFINELTKCFKLQPYCDYEALVCANLTRLKLAWKYLLGNQLMLFRLYTTRLNRFTTVDLDSAGELRDHYQVEYEKSLALSVKLIDTKDCCLECGGNPETVTWVP